MNNIQRIKKQHKANQKKMFYLPENFMKTKRYWPYYKNNKYQGSHLACPVCDGWGWITATSYFGSEDCKNCKSGWSKKPYNPFRRKLDQRKLKWKSNP